MGPNSNLALAVYLWADNQGTESDYDKRGPQARIQEGGVDVWLFTHQKSKNLILGRIPSKELFAHASPVGAPGSVTKPSFATVFTTINSGTSWTNADPSTASSLSNEQNRLLTKRLPKATNGHEFFAQAQHAYHVFRRCAGAAMLLGAPYDHEAVRATLDNWAFYESSRGDNVIGFKTWPGTANKCAWADFAARHALI